MRRAEKLAISSVIVICITAIILGYLVIRHRWIPPSQTNSTWNNEHDALGNVPSNRMARYPSATYQRLHSEIYQGESPESYRSNFMQGRRDISRYGNKFPMLFWGQVVDGDGNPLEGAICTFEWRYVPPSREHFHVVKHSDSNGMFEITEAKSTILTLRVEATNHWGLSNSSLALNYAGRWGPDTPIYVPDRMVPHKIVVVEKPPIPRQSIKYLLVQVPADGKEVRLDLEKWKFAKDGHMILTVPLSIRDNDTGDFSINTTLRIANGGFVETSDPAPFWPPSNGYTQRAMVRTVAGHAPKPTTAYFSFMSTEGRYKYGLIKATVGDLGVANDVKNHPFATVIIGIWLNEEGERAIAFDPLNGPLVTPKTLQVSEALQFGR